MQHPSERSVDEILKAIQKVIEKDARAAAPSEAEPAHDAGVMLNGGAEASPERDDAAFLVSPEAEMPEEDASILDLGEEATALPDEAPVPEPEVNAPMKAKAPIAPERIIAQIEETLTSERAADSMRRSLSNLSRISDAPESAPPSPGETTIEQLVRDMLRPMLAQWLDTNLPPLVEKLVKDEIARIARKRG